MRGIYISLGSNLKKRKENLEDALWELKERTRIVKVSSLYESEPWGFLEQNNFYNAVIEIETGLKPLMLLSVIKGIEVKLGRKKSEKWGPRIIDLDIILYGSEVIDLPNLKIPHSQVKNRLFVLMPLLEINPTLSLPSEGINLEKYLKDLIPIQNVKKIGDFDKNKFKWIESN